MLFNSIEVSFFVNPLLCLYYTGSFLKVQEMLKENRRKPSHKWSYMDYLFTDKIFCGECGAPMIGSSGTGKQGQKYNYYVCTAQRKEKTCKKKPVRQDKIEPYVLKEIQKILQDDTVLEFIAESTWKYYLDQERGAVILATYTPPPKMDGNGFAAVAANSARL